MIGVFKSKDGRVFESERACLIYEQCLDLLDLCCRIDVEVNPFTRGVISEDRVYSAAIVMRNIDTIVAITDRIREIKST
jgi:hypothetical protein